MPRLLDRIDPPVGLRVSSERAAAINRLCQKGVITVLEANDLRASGAPLPSEPPVTHVPLSVYIPPAVAREIPQATPPQAPAPAKTRKPYQRTGKYAKKSAPVSAPDSRALVVSPVADSAPMMASADRHLAHFERLALHALPAFDLAWSAEQQTAYFEAIARLASIRASLDR